MFAYSFKSQFGEPIVTYAKRQTVRGNRKRHARPGERLQLFIGMRTKQCRKLLDRDPLCISVEPIHIEWGLGGLPLIWINETKLSGEAVMAFAFADGFGTAANREAMIGLTLFWHANHGVEPFDGVVIHWDPFA